MTNRSPTLAKWPFILADVLLLVGSGWVLMKFLPYRTTGAYFVAACAVAAWIVGAIICVWPWLVEFKALEQRAQNENLTDALQQIDRLEEIGARVQAATGSWQSAQDSAMRVMQAAKEIEERIKADSKDFMEFAERINADEKQNMRLEVEKLRRNEAEWLQVSARMLDHTFALTAAALRSGQPNLATQMTNFQNACRDAARRVGLVPFHPAVGDPFEDRSQQLEDPNAKAEDGATVSDVLATGFTFQGQLLRKALVRVGRSDAEPVSAAPVEEEQVAPEETPAEAQAAEVANQAEEEVHAKVEEPPAAAAPEPVVEEVTSEVSVFKDSDSIEEAPSNETVQTEASEQSLEEEQPRRQRKPDPQTSLPF